MAIKVSEMFAILASAIDAAADVLHIADTSLGTSGDRKVTPTELVGAARGLTVDANLSGTLQDVEVRGTASALQVATDKVAVDGRFACNGSTPPAQYSFTTGFDPLTASTQDIRDAIDALLSCVRQHGFMTDAA